MQGGADDAIRIVSDQVVDIFMSGALYRAIAPDANQARPSRALRHRRLALSVIFAIVPVLHVKGQL